MSGQITKIQPVRITGLLTNKSYSAKDVNGVTRSITEGDELNAGDELKIDGDYNIGQPEFLGSMSGKASGNWNVDFIVVPGQSYSGASYWAPNASGPDDNNYGSGTTRIYRSW